MPVPVQVRSPRTLAATAVLAAMLLYGYLGTRPAGEAAPPHTQPAQRLPATPLALPTQPLGAGIAAVRLLVEPDDGKRKLTRPIRQARRTLDLTMYLLTDHTLIHDLEYAAADGVRVRVLLERRPFGNDASGTSTNQSAYDQLYAADIPVRWTSGRYALTHQKTLIVDGATAYIMTMNWSRAAFTSNREFAIADTDPADVREALAIFEADWHNTIPVLRDPNLFVSPVNSRARLLALLRRARFGVEIYAEEVQDRQLEDALVACARRGVRVRLISNAGDATNAAGIARLRAGGVRVHLLHQPYIHAKLAIADDRWAFVGSENISAASLDRNRELGVLVADPDALARLSATFEQDWSTG